MPRALACVSTAVATILGVIFAQVIPSDNIGSSTPWIGVDGLLVGDGDNHQQGCDHHSNWEIITEDNCPAAAKMTSFS